MTYKSSRSVKTAFTKLNNQINHLVEKRASLVALTRQSDRELRAINERILSLNKLLADVDFQMPRLLERHHNLKHAYLSSICRKE